MRLLQYKNQYGFIFLESFFSFVGFDGIGYDLKDNAIFIREKYYNGGRLDGLIYVKNQYALIIENKINGAGNQKEQLKKYIEGVRDDTDIFDKGIVEEDKLNRIWVVFLTREGVEIPDKVSWDYMKKCGICDDLNDIQGPRYVAINYQDHILPWLKESIQPIVMQKEQVLNTGLLQYIDFLEGMLGQRQIDKVIMNESKGWLRKWLADEEHVDLGDFKKSNELLDKISKRVKTEFKGLSKRNSEEWNIADLRRYSGILNNLLCEINDEPMSLLFEITRDYFNKNLMEECVITHIFNYYYIQIRDISWPRCIHFEWYPLGISKLTKKNVSLSFCFHIECSEEKRRGVLTGMLRSCFEKKGFQPEENSRTVSFSKKVNNTGRSIMEMNEDSLKAFLENVYSVIDKDLISNINEAIDTVWKDVSKE